MKQIQLILLILVSILLLQNCSQEKASDTDWPRFKKDNLLSGKSASIINVKSLELDWEYQADHQPEPAWYGPAYEDAFANSGALPSMRDYDLANYPIIVGDRVFYGSSSDDALHCLNAKTGKELWRYTTDGPIRIAPVYEKGVLYFGSDDGYAYAVNANNGKLKWSFSPSDQEYSKVLNNNRLISFWPIRTGLLLEDGVAYFGASLLPWKKSYFCAIDQKTGQVDSPNCYVREFDNLTLEGAMASTGTKLLQPQGRIAPAFFDKEYGDRQGSLPGSGGCFVLITPEEHIIHPKNSRNKSLHELGKGDQPDLMTFDGGKEMLVKGDTSFVLSDKSLSAYQRSTQKLLWLRKDFAAHRIILVGDYLFAGCTEEVLGISTTNGLPIWKAKTDGTVYALTAGKDALFASTDAGTIYKFKVGSTVHPLWGKNHQRIASIDTESENKKKIKLSQHFEPELGPFIKALNAKEVELEFYTKEKESCSLNWSMGKEKFTSFSSQATTHHVFRLPVKKGFRYRAEIVSASNDTLGLEYDNFFNFTLPDFDPKNFPKVVSSKEQLIEKALANDIKGKGLALILGTSALDLPASVLAKSDHFLIQMVKDKKSANKLRKELAQHHVYGTRWTVFNEEELQLGQIRKDLASLLWVESPNNYEPDVLIDRLAPRGKAVLFGLEEATEWFSRSQNAWQVELIEVDGAHLIQKKTIENQGEWTHQYAQADNSAFGGESLWGTTSTEEFEIQWMGRPGPRFQTDRSGRKPSPLSVSGKLFVQGKERVMAIDVYNGGIYWVKHIPNFIRMNVHRDCSNWAADEQHLYLGVRNKIIKLDQQTGQLTKSFHLGNPETEESAYLSVFGENLIISTAPKGSHYTDYHGGAGWYDWATGPMAEKVISQLISSIDKTEGKINWDYSTKGYVLNSTLTQLENHLYFIESRTPNFTLSDQKRAQDAVFNRCFLVALDLSSGEVLYEKKVNYQPGRTAIGMAAGQGKLVVLSSGDGQYNIYTHSAANGKQIWEDQMPWFNGDHGGHLSRPAIVGNNLIVKPAVLNLETGEHLAYNIPKSGHGCASYALTEQSIFYRGGSVTQFNFETREFSRWERLRPDCWISTIPAQGMILSPEAGGGCSCGNWLETSMVMAPLSRAPITISRAGSEHLLDYKEETYGKYTLSYKPNEFENKMDIRISGKPGVDSEIYYTVDGTEPSRASKSYRQPIPITKDTQIKTLVVVKGKQGERTYFREKFFTKIKE